MRKTILLFTVLFGVVFTAVIENSLSDSFIHKINNAQSSWKAGRNFDVNTPPHRIQALLGVKPGYKVTLPRKNISVVSNLPESFDSREKWSNCDSIKEVRDQSVCGSCWAFGAVEAMSDRICIFSNGQKQTRLSANDLLACCDECGEGCDGGYPEEAWRYWERSGIVSGDAYGTNNGCEAYAFPPCDHHTVGKYHACGDSQPTPKCTRKCDASSGLNYKEDLHYGKEVYSVDMDQKSIQTEIYNNGPVETSFNVYNDFLSYKSGVYQYTTGAFAGGHAVKIIGWGVENNLPYWLIANSWNEDWGDKGFFKIIRGKNECGIEDSIVAGTPKL